MSRSDRMAKYNQLLRIEEQLGATAIYGYKKVIDLKKAGGYLGFAVILYYASTFVRIEQATVRIIIHVLMLLFYLAIVFVIEKPRLAKAL